MLENLITGLIVAAIGALTFIAYKHNNTYKKIHESLSWIPILIFLGLTIWNIAIDTAYDSMVDLIDYDKLKVSRNIKVSLQISSFGIIFIITIISHIYLRVLVALPKLLNDQGEKSEHMD